MILLSFSINIIRVDFVNISKKVVILNSLINASQFKYTIAK